MTAPLQFTFDDRTIVARPGQSVAAALIEAGIREYRETKSGQWRGVFCGMGVCQECLVEIDGRPNQRACMAKVAPGIAVRRQLALPDLRASAPAADTPSPRRETPDVLVIGGGAGGLTAAIAAARAGARTLLLDERRVPGGQYFKQTAPDLEMPPLDGQQREGTDLVGAAEAAGVEILHGTEVWGAFQGPVFYAERDGGALIVEPKATIVATGAYERPLMVPGWHLPGVMTVGAAQTLWRSYRTLPGRRVAVFGSGPLNYQVALELLDGGADVRIVAEAAAPPWSKPAAFAAMIAADPKLALRGAAMLSRLAAKGSAPRYRTLLDRIEPWPDGLRAYARADGGGIDALDVDAVCMNYGFQPQNEILRLLGAAMTYDTGMDQLRPVRSEIMETSVSGLFAIGDCCGLGGAPAAQVEGHIAGAAAAVASGASTAVPDTASTRRLSRHRRFQTMLWRLYDAAARPLADAPAGTLVCRCEEVTRADVDAALGKNVAEIGSVKRTTRLGMGRCQGRYCGPALARYLAGRTDRPMEDLSFFAPRTPIKPVPIRAILAAHEAEGDL